MGQEYVPFPPFEGWLPSYNGSLVDEVGEQIANARERYGQEAADRAVEVASRYAAVDTGALEGLYTTNRGFTRTIAERTANWEAALAAHPEAAHHIRDALAGYEFVLDAVTAARPVTEAWIRQLYEVLLASQDGHDVFVEVAGTLHRQRRALARGAYKTEPNFPTDPDTGVMHHYAPVEDTAAEMGRLIAQLRDHRFEAAHPILQAAYAHYAFVCVHPFTDGNGRVARALASVFLYRQPGIPLVIFADQREAYLDALTAADAGRPHAFVSFVEERAIDAAHLVLAELGSDARRGDAELGAALRRDLGRGTLAVVLATPGDLHAALRFTVAMPDRVDQTGGWSLTGPASHQAGLRVLSQVECENAALDVLLREVHPRIADMFRHRLTAWVRGLLSDLSGELAAQIRVSGEEG